MASLALGWIGEPAFAHLIEPIVYALPFLPPESRELILEYYQEDRRAKIQLRQQLADRLHIPLNALRIRTHRIRMSLEECIKSCLQSYAEEK